jgi:hypothetical protein
MYRIVIAVLIYRRHKLTDFHNKYGPGTYALGITVDFYLRMEAEFCLRNDVLNKMDNVKKISVS